MPQEDEPAALAARGTAPGESAAGPHSSDEALVIDPSPSAGVPVPPLPAQVKAAFGVAPTAHKSATRFPATRGTAPAAGPTPA